MLQSLGLGFTTFLSTLSLRRATHFTGFNRKVVIISIHALLAESDRIKSVFFQQISKFLSTLSLRRATTPIKAYNIIKGFLSTLSLRRATNVCPDTRRHDAISIHALLAESDVRVVEPGLANRLFLSTLSLRRATTLKSMTGQILIFLSTLSLRRATPRGGGLYYLIPNFYPRSPCGERQCLFG